MWSHTQATLGSTKYIDTVLFMVLNKTDAIYLFSIFLFSATENSKPEKQHPLPSYLDYKQNNSVRNYQTNYFPSKCAENPDGTVQNFEINVGDEMDSLGGKCEQDQKPFCDGPLNSRTSYRSGVLEEGLRRSQIVQFFRILHPCKTNMLIILLESVSVPSLSYLMKIWAILYFQTPISLYP